MRYEIESKVKLYSDRGDYRCRRSRSLSPRNGNLLRSLISWLIAGKESEDVNIVGLYLNIFWFNRC